MIRSYFFIFLFSMLSSATIAGNTELNTNPERMWNLKSAGETITASLVLYRDGFVYLENLNHQAIKLPVAALSASDKQFVLENQAQINTSNYLPGVKIEASESGTVFGFLIDSGFVTLGGFIMLFLFMIRVLFLSSGTENFRSI
jgi:hypothetical protein